MKRAISSILIMFAAFQMNSQITIEEKTLMSGNAWLIEVEDDDASVVAASFEPRLDAVKASGMKYVRIGGIGPNWDHLYNYNPTTLAITNYTILTYLIEKVRAKGMDVILQVAFHPTCTAYQSANGFNNVGDKSTAEQAEIAANLVDKLNNDLGLNVRFWIISNEPDLPVDNCSNPEGLGLSLQTDGHTIADYIKTFAFKMKSKDPNIKIIAPEMAQFGNDVNFSIHKLMADLVSHPNTKPTTSIMDYTSVPSGTTTISVPFVDFISFHHYKEPASTAEVIASPTFSHNGFARKLNSFGIPGRRGLVEMIVGAGRGGDCQIACTEYNIDLTSTPQPTENINYTDMINGIDNRSFLGGQWMAEVNMRAMEESFSGAPMVKFMNLWSVKEGNCDKGLGYISACNSNNNIPRPMYWHYWMVANNFKGTFFKVSYNDKYSSDVKAWAAASDDRIAVLILNQSANSFSFAVNLHSTSAPTPTAGFASIGFNIPAASGSTVYTALGASSTTSLLAANSTVLLIFNCKGQGSKRWDFEKAGLLPASPSHSPQPTTLGSEIIGNTLSSINLQEPITTEHSVTVNLPSQSNYTYTWEGSPCHPVVSNSNNGATAVLVSCGTNSMTIYNFTVTDPGGCSAVKQFSLVPTVGVSGSQPAVYFKGFSPSQCNGATGSATVEVEDCFGSPTFAWDNGSPGSNTVATGLAPGLHTLQVFSCYNAPAPATFFFLIPEDKSSLPRLDAGLDKRHQRLCTVHLSAHPNMEPSHTYEWYKGSAAVPSSTNNTWSFTAWTSDVYRVKVTDYNGCVNWDTVAVKCLSVACSAPPTPPPYSSIPCDEDFNEGYITARSMSSDYETLTENTTYNRDRYINKMIVVPEGITLNIENCEIRFAEGAGITVVGGTVNTTDAWIVPCPPKIKRWIRFDGTGSKVRLT